MKFLAAILFIYGTSCLGSFMQVYQATLMNGSAAQLAFLATGYVFVAAVIFGILKTYKKNGLKILWLLPVVAGFSRLNFRPIETMHFVLFGTLGYFLFEEQPAKRAWVILLFACISDEALQGFLPKRYFDWLDVFWNFAGGLLGYGVLLTLKAIKKPSTSG